MGFRKKIVLILAILPYLSHSQVGLDGNIAIQNYRAIEAAYARELTRPTGISTPFDSQITFVQQRGTLSQKERDALAIYNLVPRELDFANVDQVSDNELINDAYRDETFLFREHIKKIEQFRADPLEVLIDHIKSIMQKTMSIPRSYDRNDLITSSTVKEGIAAYILHKFASLGYLTGLQRFVPKHFITALPILQNGQPVKGTNIIAIAPGTNFGTKADRILVVGAHWDTVTNSAGFDDNGSGMAALLEMARALKQSQCRNSHTYILVAFDLGETGTQGSTAFVQDFLIRSILRPQRYPEFQGAYILDSIANYNGSAGSQLLPETYQFQLPEFSQGVVRDGNRGDFIGVVGRRVDQPLFDLFSFHWNNQPDLGLRFKLRNMVLPEDLNANFPEEISLVRNTNFLRSDHIRFWFSNNQDYYASFKSVHLGDTGPARGVMSECYHAFCDTAALNETVPFANIYFLKKTTQALVSTVIDATDSQCHRSRMEVRRMGRSIDGNYLFFDKNLQQPIYQFGGNQAGVAGAGVAGTGIINPAAGGVAAQTILNNNALAVSPVGVLPGQPTALGLVGGNPQDLLSRTNAGFSPIQSQIIPGQNQFFGNGFQDQQNFFLGNGLAGQQFGLGQNGLLAGSGLGTNPNLLGATGLGGNPNLLGASAFGGNGFGGNGFGATGFGGNGFGGNGFGATGFGGNGFGATGFGGNGFGTNANLLGGNGFGGNPNLLGVNAFGGNGLGNGLIGQNQFLGNGLGGLQGQQGFFSGNGLAGGGGDVLGRSLLGGNNILSGGTVLGPQGISFNGHPLGSQHSFYPGKNLLNQLSRNGLTTSLNPFLIGNNQFGPISGGFSGNGGFQNNLGRKKRSKKITEAWELPNEEGETLVDIQR